MFSTPQKDTQPVPLILSETVASAHKWSRLLVSLPLTRNFSVTDVPSNPYSVRLSSVAQRVATVTFTKPDSHGGVPISYYLVKYKDISSQDWKDVKSQGTQSKCNGSPLLCFFNADVKPPNYTVAETIKNILPTLSF